MSLLSFSFHYFTTVAFFCCWIRRLGRFWLWDYRWFSIRCGSACSNMFYAVRCVLVLRITIFPATFATCYNFESVCDSSTCTYAERMRRKSRRWNEMLCAMRCGRCYLNCLAQRVFRRFRYARDKRSVCVCVYLRPCSRFNVFSVFVVAHFQYCMAFFELLVSDKKIPVHYLRMLLLRCQCFS